MKRIVAAVWCSVVCLPVVAGEPTIIKISDTEYWYSAGDGTPTVRVTNVIPPPGDTPPPPDPDPEPTELRQKVEAWALEVDDPTGAKLMGRTYQFLADGIKNGSIPANANDIDKVMTRAIDQTIDLIPGDKDDEWEEVHEKITEELAKLVIAGGGQLSKTAWVAFFQQTALGFEDATEGKVFDEFLDLLLETLLKLLLRLIEDLFNDIGAVEPPDFQVGSLPSPRRMRLRPLGRLYVR